MLLPELEEKVNSSLVFLEQPSQLCRILFWATLIFTFEIFSCVLDSTCTRLHLNLPSNKLFYGTNRSPFIIYRRRRLFVNEHDISAKSVSELVKQLEFHSQVLTAAFCRHLSNSTIYRR